jgi:hypothetical protein
VRERGPNVPMVAALAPAVASRVRPASGVFEVVIYS